MVWNTTHGGPVYLRYGLKNIMIHIMLIEGIENRLNFQRQPLVRVVMRSKYIIDITYRCAICNEPISWGSILQPLDIEGDHITVLSDEIKTSYDRLILEHKCIAIQE